MLDFLSKITGDDVQNWIAVVAGIITFVKLAREKDRTDKFAYIKAITPEAHNLAQKVAKATKHTKKDDEFVAQIDKILKGLGWTVKPHEVESIKALGSGYHQDYKDAVSAEGNLLELMQPSEDAKPLDQEA